MYRQKLNQMKEESKMTVQQIADLSMVPKSTINRILSGETENPTFDSVAGIVKAVGGSLDELAGIEHGEKVLSADQQLISLYREMLDSRYHTIQRQVAENAKKSRIIFWMGCVTTLVLVIFIAFLIFDLTHLNVGFIRS